MSWTCLETNKTVTVRKRHSCNVCDGFIERGEQAVTRSGVDSDGFVRMYMHIECEEYSSDWDDQDWECFSMGVSRKEVLEEFAKRK